MIRAHQPGSEPIDIPETIPNPVVVPKPTPTPTEPAPKEPVRIPERVPGTARLDLPFSTSALDRFADSSRTSSEVREVPDSDPQEDLESTLIRPPRRQVRAACSVR